MPAKSEKQRRFFGIVLAIKRGDIPKSYSPEAARIAKKLSVSKIREFAVKTVNPKKLLKALRK